MDMAKELHATSNGCAITRLVVVLNRLADAVTLGTISLWIGWLGFVMATRAPPGADRKYLPVGVPIRNVTESTTSSTPNLSYIEGGASCGTKMPLNLSVSLTACRAMAFSAILPPQSSLDGRRRLLQMPYFHSPP